MTDQRKVTTDPGLGPVQREHASTLRSMTAADPIPEDEIPGVPVYYEPKPLHAVSDHKTLELETVKLAKDIDPRKLPTELKLRRPVLHVLPASDPNWPAPAPQPEVGATPLFDSNWPPPETVLTTSHPPLAPRRRSFVPLVLLVVLAACSVLVLGARRARHRALAPAVAVQAAQPSPAVAPVAAPAAPANVEPAPSAVLAPEASEAASANTAPPAADSAESPESADAPDTAESPTAATSAAASAEPAASAAPARADAHHPPFKSTSSSIANSPALNAAPTAKPKRAIY